MDIRVMQYFLSVARHLNFTKAANECHVAQAAVSQAIDKLERELGFRLFIRSSRFVELTPAGEVLATDVQELMTLYQKAISRARKTACGQDGMLHIGFLGQYEYMALSKVLQEFQKSYPEVEVMLSYIDCREMEKLLRKREIHVVFASSWEFSGARDIQVDDILSDRICAIMNKNHPLAQYSSITSQQLEGQPIITIQPVHAPHLYHKMVEDCRLYGFEPQIAAETNTFDTMLLMVESGLGIALFPARIQQRMSSNLKGVDLLGSTMTHVLAVGRLRNIDNPALENFYTMVQKHLFCT